MVAFFTSCLMLCSRIFLLSPGDFMLNLHGRCSGYYLPTAHCSQENQAIKSTHADSSWNVYWIVVRQKPKRFFRNLFQEVKKWQDSCGKKKSWAPGHLILVLPQVCLWLAYVILRNLSASVCSLVHRELKSPWPVSQIAVIAKWESTHEPIVWRECCKG